MSQKYLQWDTFDPPPKAMKIKTKTKQMGPNYIQKLLQKNKIIKILHSKGSHKQGEK